MIAAIALQKLLHDRAFQSENELESTKARLNTALHENAIARAHIAALQVIIALSILVI